MLFPAEYKLIDFYHEYQAKKNEKLYLHLEYKSKAVYAENTIKIRMEIYKLTTSDWEIYKELRLDALKENTESFGDSFEESVRHHDDEWKKELENPKSYILVARDYGKVFGMVAGYQEDNLKMRHMAYVWGVYVRHAQRRQGIGRKLMEALISEFSSNKEIEKIDLNVNTSQLPAVRLYEKLGFAIAGTLHKELKVDGKYFDEHVMEKFLQ
jgi:ribosomal protein S18 acetylase RimI-like enzyme